MGQRPSGISIRIREDLVAGSARTQTTLICDPIITLDGHRLVTADIGDICFAKINQGTSNEEIISFTGITDNTSTYTLTGCVWGYNFYNSTGSVEANKKKQNSGSSLIITNDDHYLTTQYVNSDSDQTIGGEKTFSVTPKSTAGDPLVATDLVIKSYVDALVLGTLTTINVIVPGKAGETVAAGNLVYFDLTDNEWKLTDANTAATVENVLLGIAQGAGTNGNAITDGVLLQGVDDNQSGLTEGDVYYASDTAGAIANTAGTVEMTVGLGKSATELYFNPRFNQQITEDQQDALAGTSGTPSVSNKYVTADDVSDAAVSGKIVRATGTALPALSGENLTNVVAEKVYKSLLAGENLTAGNAVSAGFYQADGGITYDTSAKKTGSQSGGTVTQTITIANNTNRVLIATLVWTNSADWTNVTYNGVAMTEVTSEGFNSANGGLKTYVLFAPDAGSAFTFSASLSGSTIPYAITLHSYYNVTQAVHLSADMHPTNVACTLTSTPTLDGTMIFSAMGSASTGTLSSIVNMANNRQDNTTNVSLYAGDSGFVYPKKATTVSATGSANEWAMASLVFSPITVPTFNTVLKADASALVNAANLSKTENFIGFAVESKNANEQIKIQTNGIVTLTGLNPFQTYYLSNTDGAISATAGTVSKKVGVAISTTELLIKHDNT